MWPVVAELPEILEFLHVGWWMLHIAAITTVALTGYVIGRRAGAGREKGAAYLPEPYRFFRIGWWVTHLVAIPLFFLIGYLVGGAYRAG